MLKWDCWKTQGYQSQHQNLCKPRCAVRLSITCNMHLKCPRKYVSCPPLRPFPDLKGRFRGSNAVRGGVANDRSRPAHQTCWRIANPSSQNASVSHCGGLVPAVSAGATPVFKWTTQSPVVALLNPSTLQLTVRLSSHVCHLTSHFVRKEVTASWKVLFWPGPKDWRFRP